MKRVLAVLLALLSGTAAAAGGDSGGADDLLPADQAFVLMPAERNGVSLALQWAIAPGYYLYRARIHAVEEGKSSQPLPLALPPGLTERDPLGESHEIYRSAVRATLRLSASHPPQRLRVTYQGCADAGVCFPPQTRVIPVPSAP